MIQIIYYRHQNFCTIFFVSIQSCTRSLNRKEANKTHRNKSTCGRRCLNVSCPPLPPNTAEKRRANTTKTRQFSSLVLLTIHTNQIESNEGKRKIKWKIDRRTWSKKASRIVSKLPIVCCPHNLQAHADTRGANSNNRAIVKLISSSSSSSPPSSSKHYPRLVSIHVDNSSASMFDECIVTLANDERKVWDEEKQPRSSLSVLA